MVNDSIYQYPKNISLYKYLKVPKISIIIKNGSYLLKYLNI